MIGIFVRRIKTHTRPFVLMLKISTNALVIIYKHIHAGKNPQRRILPSGHVATSSVHVHAHELSLRIDHFSWFIVTFFRKLFNRQNHIEICCYSLLPTCIPQGRRVTLHVQVYKAAQGMREVISPYCIYSPIK